MTGWELGWSRYTGYDDIIADKERKTFFAFFEERDQTTELFDKFVNTLSNDGFMTEVKYEERDWTTIYRITHKQKGVEMLAQNYIDNCMIVQSLNPRSDSEVSRYLNQLEAMDYDINDWLCVASVEHGLITIRLKTGKALSVVVKTGAVKGLDEKGILVPYSFYMLKQSDKLIGQALVKYYHDQFDITECGPTIVMFEILRKYRDKGLGGSLLELIEKLACESGFTKIFLSDTHSNYFWHKHDYDIDIDEGEKELECW